MIPVTADTPYLALETMDSKVRGDRYPIFMIDNKYGGRGHNFRAATNSFGITMLILGTFPDERTRRQMLFRVGRFSDTCKRIQDSKFDDVDLVKNAKRKGQIEKAMTMLVKDRVRNCKAGKIPLGSATEFKENYLPND